MIRRVCSFAVSTVALVVALGADAHAQPCEVVKDDAAELDDAGSAVTATYTLFDGNGTDHGGVASSIEFAGPALLIADYHLGYGSTAVDQGVDLLWVTADIDGQPRPFGPAPDLGADEVPVYFVPLVLRS